MGFNQSARQETRPYISEPVNWLDLQPRPHVEAPQHLRSLPLWGGIGQLKNADRIGLPTPNINRSGELKDFACATLYLCSGEAVWLTGVELTVDGARLSPGSSVAL